MPFEYTPPVSVSQAVNSQLQAPKVTLERAGQSPDKRKFEPSRSLDVLASYTLPRELADVSTESLIAKDSTFQLARNLQSCEQRTSGSITDRYPSPSGRYDGFWSQLLNAVIQNGDFCLNNETVGALAGLYIAYNGDIGKITNLLKGNKGQSNRGSVGGRAGIFVDELPPNLYKLDGRYYIDSRSSQPNYTNNRYTTFELHFNAGGRLRRQWGASSIKIIINFGLLRRP